MRCIYYVFLRFRVPCGTWLSPHSKSYHEVEEWLGTYGYVLAWQFHLPSHPRQGIIRNGQHHGPSSRLVYRAIHHQTSAICVAPFHVLFVLRDVLLQPKSLCLQSFWLLSDAPLSNKLTLRLQLGQRLPLPHCYPI